MKSDFKKLFDEYLYNLSLNNQAKYYYLEGGYALSFIYNFPRKFSTDIDFTISREEFIGRFVKQSISILQRIIKDFNSEEVNNKIKVYEKNRYLFDIDYYFVPYSYFEFKEINLVYGNNKFVFNVHTLKDILCEKILNVIQYDRFEFKDVIDINLIFEKNLEVKNLNKLLKIKSDKKINQKSRKEIIGIINSNTYKFEPSHEKDFSEYDFFKEFEKLLNNLNKLSYEKK